MALFKSKEEKEIEKKEKIKQQEDIILKHKKFYIRIGHTHQGLGLMGVWSTINNGKIKFKPTSVEIRDDRLFFERNKNVIYLSQIKEVFKVNNREAVIILNDDSGIPLKQVQHEGDIKLQAIINVLNNLIENNKSKNDSTNEIKSEDKFDRLIKLGEMHDKGLLTDEEFFSLKQELLSGTNEDATDVKENNIETPENTCKKCGADISPDDAFCSECGTQIE